MSTLEPMLEPEGLEVRRLEVITGTGRRRRFSDKDKARIVEETLARGAAVSAVARRYGLTPQQVFTWRRQARAHSSSGQDWKAPAFVPAMIDTAVPPMAPPGAKLPRGGEFGSAIIEMAIEGVTVRVWALSQTWNVVARDRRIRRGFMQRGCRTARPTRDGD